MQSQSDSNEELRFSIDHCLCFDHPEEEIATLMLSGSCRAPDPSSPVEIRISLHGEKIASITPSHGRGRGEGQNEGASVECGFHVHLPLHHRLQTGDRIELEIRSGKQNQALGRQVTHIHSFLEAYAESCNLSERVRGKLSNLLLNETERIHHVKGVRSSPIYLRLDPSWACTLDCPFCHANLLKKRGFSRKEMNAGTFQNIMDRFGKDLIAARLGTWGEPFLNPAVTGYIRAMKEYGIHVSADSHLNHDWTDDDIGEIISSGLDLLVASIDGATQESYVRYRKGGSLDRALENVRTIVQKKREIRRETPRIRWQYLLFDWNEGEVEMARKLSEESGCDEFVAKRGDTFEPYTPFLEYRDNSFMDSMTPGIRERMTRFCKERNEKKEYFGCDLLYHQLVIHADGSIHPCAYVHEPRVLYGSVHLKKDVFNTAHYKNARRLFIQPPPQECQGYNPCLNCTVVTDDHHEGYVPGDMDFFSAFELLTGEKLNV